MIFPVKLLGMALLVATLGAAVGSAAAQRAASAADEALYLRRLADPAFRVGEAYDILETVVGASKAVPLAVAANPQLSPDAAAKANAYAEKTNSKALLIWKDGAVQDALYSHGADPTTLQKSRSMGKPMGAVAVGLAIRDGAIRSVDQKAVDFIPEWQGTPKAAITIRELLNMTAGFMPQGRVLDPQSPPTRAFLDPHNDDYVIQHYPLIAAPGSRYTYAGSSADLVTIIVERATHQRIARFISTELLLPIGAPGGQLWLNREGGLGHVGCCLLLPAETWLRIGILLSQDGVWDGRRILPPGYVATMQETSEANPHYGLGLNIPTRDPASADVGWTDKVKQSEPYLAKDLYLFDGNANQVMYMIPSQRLVILRMGDAPPKSAPWDNTFLVNLVLRDLTR